MNPICPYCRTEVGSAKGERTDCPGCGTTHHSDCFTENGGCTVFGCSQAPVDEPKIHLSGTDLTSSVQPLVQPARQFTSAPTVSGAAQTDPLPPPPPAADTTNAPPPPPAYSAPSTERHFLQPTPAEEYAGLQRPRSRVAFVLLGIFLGVFGVHNFYAGYVRKGVFQLCLTLFTCFYGSIISWVWAIVEVCIVNKDFDDVQFT